LAIFSNDTVVVVTLSLIIFVNQSTITTIVSCPFDFDNGPMILILISYQGPSGVSNGSVFLLSSYAVLYFVGI